MTLRWMPNTRTSKMDRRFNELWRPFPFADFAQNPETRAEQAPNVAMPPLDVLNYDDRVELQVSLPGVAPEEVQLQVEKGLLTLSAHTAPATDETAPYTRQERYHGAYQRSLRLSEDLDADNATAHFEHGVLYLSIPKKAPVQPKRIAIQAAKAE